MEYSYWLLCVDAEIARFINIARESNLEFVQHLLDTAPRAVPRVQLPIVLDFGDENPPGLNTLLITTILIL